MEEVTFEEWDALVVKAWAGHRGEAQALLNGLAQAHPDDGWRYNAVRHLVEQRTLKPTRRERRLAQKQDREVRELVLDADCRDFA